MRNLYLIFSLLIFTTASWGGNKAAVVKIIKGDAYVVSAGKKIKLNVNDWVESDSVLHTSVKSFIKLIFIDKSQMNVGPQTEIKIEKFHAKDAGVIDLVKGKIRSQVSKDYLQINGKDRSKLFIKTSNSVMGVRGTDFTITTNGKNTAAILFEGEVVFNRLTNRKITDSAKLDEIVDRGVRMFPGEFSAVGESGAPTIPALLSVGQRDKLEKNVNFAKDSGGTRLVMTKSIVPPGLQGKVVSSEPDLSEAVSPKGSTPSLTAAGTPSSVNPDSYFKRGQIKPANGSMIHLDSATIIAPGADAILDKNTNTYIASDVAGVIDKDGEYIPPAGISINDAGNLLITRPDSLKTSEVTVESPIVALQNTTVDAGARTEQLIYTVIDYQDAIAKITITDPTDKGTTTDEPTTVGTTTGDPTTVGTTTGDPTTVGTTTGEPTTVGTTTGDPTTGGTTTGEPTTGGTRPGENIDSTTTTTTGGTTATGSDAIQK